MYIFNLYFAVLENMYNKAHQKSVGNGFISRSGLFFLEAQTHLRAARSYVAAGCAALGLDVIFHKTVWESCAPHVLFTFNGKSNALHTCRNVSAPVDVL